MRFSQAVMSSRLAARLQGLAVMPPHTGAPASASFMHALEAALGRYPSGPAHQGLQGTGHLVQVLQGCGPALQGLYAGLLQQALRQLLDGAAASFAALPVVGAAVMQQSQGLDRQLLHLLGQVSPPHLHQSHILERAISTRQR